MYRYRINVQSRQIWLASVTKRVDRENDFVIPNAVKDVHRWSQSSKLSVPCVSLRVLPKGENSVNRSGAKYVAYNTIRRQIAQRGLLVDSTSGPIARQAHMDRYQPEHNPLPCLTTMAQLVQNLGGLAGNLLTVSGGATAQAAPELREGMEK